MDKPFVSIIVPVYHAEAYIDKCLQSMLNQSFADFEVILVLNAANEESIDICDQYTQRDSRFSIIDLKEKKGVALARNRGITEARGEYVSFCDADDIMHKEMIGRLVAVAKGNDADIVSCSYDKFVDEYNPTDVIHDNIERFETSEFLKLILSDDDIRGYVWNKMIRKDLIDETGARFPEDLVILEDELFLLQLLKRKLIICVVRDKLYAYRQSSDSVTHMLTQETVLNYVDGSERIFESIKAKKCSEEVWRMAWNHLFKAYVGAYRQIQNKRQKKNIVVHFKNYETNQYFDNTWKLRTKVLYYFIKMQTSFL